MRNLQSLVAGSWQVGTGEPQTLVNPTTEEVVAYTSAEGLDLEATVSFARNEGGPALRALTLAERGNIGLYLPKGTWISGMQPVPVDQ